MTGSCSSGSLARVLTIYFYFRCYTLPNCQSTTEFTIDTALLPRHSFTNHTHTESNKEKQQVFNIRRFVTQATTPCKTTRDKNTLSGNSTPSVPKIRSGRMRQHGTRWFWWLFSSLFKKKTTTTKWHKYFWELLSVRFG